MPKVHFLNVKSGDCTWIKHYSGHNTVIDVCNGNQPFQKSIHQIENLNESRFGGNFNQKAHPVNPIEYLRKFGVSSVFRFILTHPDMDHMDGIKPFFQQFNPINFWDTKHHKEMGSFEGSPYSEDDWIFYEQIRKSPPENLTRLTLFDGARGKYYNQSSDESTGGDGLQILAPTKELVSIADEKGDYNDSSYVILYRTHGRKILFAGDSHDETWEHLLENHHDDVSNVDLLIAPHHGRDSERDHSFLDVVNPKLTFFGNASSKHLAYQQWSRRGLEKITNNQGGSLIADIKKESIDIYCTNQAFATSVNQRTSFSEKLDAYFVKSI